MNRFIRYWLPPIAWMALIFTLSSRPHISVSEEYITNFIIFKSLHMIEYATLFSLLFRALYSQKSKKTPLSTIMTRAALFAVLYGATDELHQLFVPTREGTIRDVIIDSAGIFLMYIYIKHNIHWLKRFIV